MKKDFGLLCISIMGIGFLIALIGLWTGLKFRLDVSILWMFLGVFIAVPASVLYRIGQFMNRGTKHEQSGVEEKVPQGHDLLSLISTDVDLVKEDRLWVSWKPVVYSLWVALAAGVLGGSLLGWFFGFLLLIAGFWSVIVRIFVGGVRKKERTAVEGMAPADDQGIVFQSTPWKATMEQYPLPAGVYSCWRHYHLARTMLRFCVAGWLFAAILYSFFLVIDYFRGHGNVADSFQKVAAAVCMAMLTTSPAILLALIVGAFSRWRLRRWERREESKRK